MRPVEIYAYSNTPMRTFHESKDGTTLPIRLSYHGESHYNSIIMKDNEFTPLLSTTPGDREKEALKMVHHKKESPDLKINDTEVAAAQKEEEVKTEVNSELQDLLTTKTREETVAMYRDVIMKSRSEFEQMGKRNMQKVLIESMNTNYHFDEAPDKNEEEVIKESDVEYTNTAQVEEALKISQ